MALVGHTTWRGPALQYLDIWEYMGSRDTAPLAFFGSLAAAEAMMVAWFIGDHPSRPPL